MSRPSWSGRSVLKGKTQAKQQGFPPLTTPRGTGTHSGRSLPSAGPEQAASEGAGGERGDQLHGILEESEFPSHFVFLELLTDVLNFTFSYGLHSALFCASSTELLF